MSNNDPIEGAGHQGVGKSEVFALCTRRINGVRTRDVGIIFGSLATFSLVVAVGFAAHGAWLILPFAGLEAMALYLAFNWVVRHADDAEQLVIHGDAVMLAVREEAHTRHYAFNRVWARLVVQRREREVRLALCSGSNEVEIGRYLDSSGRQRLAQELKSRLHVR